MEPLPADDRDGGGGLLEDGDGPQDGDGGSQDGGGGDGGAGRPEDPSPDCGRGRTVDSIPIATFLERAFREQRTVTPADAELAKALN